MSLNKAAEVLAERYPEYAFSARVLREMCDARVVRCMMVPSNGLQRTCRYFVRPAQVVEDLRKYEVCNAK